MMMIDKPKPHPPKPKHPPKPPVIKSNHFRKTHKPKPHPWKEPKE
jgi:hypothetical protein